MKQFLLPCALLLAGSVFAQTPILEENFDSYEAGAYIGVASEGVWTTWSGVTGTDEDGIVSDEFAQSGTNSLKIFGAVGGGPMDVVLPIDISEAYELSFSIYVPSGNAAYLNIQETATIGEAWAFDMTFDSNGTAELQIDQVTSETKPYNMDAWNSVSFRMDPVNDRAEIYLNDEYMNNILFDDIIGSLNLYGYGDGVAPGLYYIDDLIIVETDDVMNSIAESDLELSFGPNPASNYIQLSSNVNEGIIRILALNGQVVSEKTLNNLSSGARVDLNLENGIYLVELSSGVNRTMHKLVVNK